jgi:hypothetical protein
MFPSAEAINGNGNTQQQWKPRKLPAAPLSLQLVGHKEKGSRRSKGILEALSHIYFRFFSS